MGALKQAALWPYREVRGWASNVRELIGEVSWRDFLPPAVIETAKWVKEQLTFALGFGTAQQQLSASFALGVAAIFSSIITLGATIALVAFFAFTFMVGAFRLWPVFDRLWLLGSNEGAA